MGKLIARTDETNPAAIIATRNQSRMIHRRAICVTSASLFPLELEAAR